VFSTPAGAVRLSTGACWRWESFDDLIAGFDLKRGVLGIDGEVLVPIVGEQNALPWVRRLELSLAVRRDEYRGAGAAFPNLVSVNPKIGLLWSPLTDWNFRGTYATSFRVAPLPQMHGSDSAELIPLANPAAPGTPINTLYLTGGNPDLRPELAKSFTAGFDWRPHSLPDSGLSATVFHIQYTDRVGTPPMVGSVSSAYSQLATLGPFINSDPSAAQIQSVYDHYFVYDPLQIGRANVQAIFDSRLQNIASTLTSGIESNLKLKTPTRWGDWTWRLQGQYLFQLDNKATPTTPSQSSVDTVFNPSKLRAQIGADWSHQGWTISTTADYTNSYQDTLVATAATVASWLIFDGRVSYATGTRFASAWKNTTVSLSVGNITDRRPPYVRGAAATLDYDPTNASPLGRVVSLQITKQWL
jgi:iron complex outermembrane recepter protein